MRILIQTCSDDDLRRLGDAWPEAEVTNGLSAADVERYLDWAAEHPNPATALEGVPDLYIMWYRAVDPEPFELDVLDAVHIGIPRVVALIDPAVPWRDVCQLVISARTLYWNRKPCPLYEVALTDVQTADQQLDWTAFRRLIDDEYSQRLAANTNAR